MWLDCIGVVSGCCCKEVYIYINILIIITYPYYIYISSLFGSSIPTSLFSFKTLLNYRVADTEWSAVLGAVRSSLSHTSIHNEYNYNN